MMKSNEKMYFLYGYLYAKAEEIKKESKTEKTINEIIAEIIKAIEYGKEKDEENKEQIMISIKGEQQRCECGANVFTKITKERIKCNACGLDYEIE